MSLADIADQLATARRDSMRIDGDLMDSLQSETEAYQLQSLLEASYRSAQIGYKVAATNEPTQKKFGTDHPFYGPLFEADCHQTGVSFSGSEGLLGGEAEFAFLIDRDIPGNTPLNTQSIIDYIRAVHVSVELIGRRTKGNGLPSLYSAIADFGGNAAFILGPAIDNWTSMDLASVKVVAHTDGQETNSGSGAAVLGHPLNSLLWLSDTLIAAGDRLKAGQWVITGTCLGVIPPKTDSTVVVSFAGCGEVSYQIT